MTEEMKEKIYPTVTQACGYMSACVNVLLGDDENDYRQHFNSLPRNGSVGMDDSEAEVLDLIKKNLEFLLGKINKAKPGRRGNLPSYFFD